MRRELLLLACSLVWSTSVAAQEPAELVPDAPETDCVDAVEAAPMVAASAPRATPAPEPSPEPAPDPPARTAPRPAIPSGRAVAGLSENECLALLEAHQVPFERLSEAEAGGVEIPIRLHGSLGGVRVASRGHWELHEIMDCRLAVAVLSWAPALREAGVEGLLHYSVYRPGAHVGGSDRRSAHAGALAIDLAVLVMEDGSEHEVLTGWEDRARGVPPCTDVHDEGPDSARMRRLVCGVATSELFQVVLTPHYDGAHANHVHLELRPDVDWEYVR